MQKARRILRNVNVINLILAVVLALLLGYAVLPLLGKTVRITLPVPKKHPGTAASAEKPADAKTPSPADFIVIADQNLFHPERKIPVEKKETAAPPLPKPDFVLYGTLLTDDLHVAYMEDRKAPQSSPARGKKQIPVKLGESLSGFILKEIDADKVVMIRGDEKIDVSMSDTTKTREMGPGAPVARPVQPPPVSQPGTPVPQPQPRGGLFRPQR